MLPRDPATTNSPPSECTPTTPFHHAQSGKEEYKARGKEGVFMLPEDLAIRDDPELSALARAFAADNPKFLRAFAAAWTKGMNADRFAGPVSNACDAPAPAAARRAAAPAVASF